ncbi:MAG: hypothetical protein K0R99_3717 [Microbacterium sp.]|jgi:hypothetical protein|nr:hypothetical protein [Microbacterium sp.]
MSAESTPGRQRAKGVEHGTITMYASRGCRCDECKAGNAAYQRARRVAAAEKLAAGARVEHGTVHAYRHYGCRSMTAAERGPKT